MSENTERVWVMSSATPTEAGENGLHYRYCPTFKQPARLAVGAELSLRPCSFCGPDDRSHGPPPCRHNIVGPCERCADEDGDSS